MDTTTLGETAAHLMDDLADAFEDDDSAEVGIVMVIAEIKGEDDECDWTSVRCCSTRSTRRSLPVTRRSRTTNERAERIGTVSE